MSRKTNEEIEKIKKKYNTDRIWSWSRINTYKNSPYEYFLKYIKREKEDRQDCIYAVTGGMAHDIMENFYVKKIGYSDMDSDFEDAWLTAGIADLKFDRNDDDKNKKIADKYYKNLKHFFNNHVLIPYKVEIERFISVMIGKNLFQGYIDVCFKDKNGYYNILDWKTSSIYKGKKALNECGQLVVYAVGLHQMGVPYDKIKICWNFLKYVKASCEQANGNWKTREIDRCEIGNKLYTSVRMWLKKLGYEDKLDNYLDIFLQTNDIKSLPKDVQTKYKLSDCIVYVDLTEELINKWETDIINTISEIIEKENMYNTEKVIDDEKAEKIFFDTPESVEKQSYYFASLCAYSPKLHKPYKVYLDKLEARKNGSDFFSGIGENISESNDDMSWLEQL